MVNLADDDLQKLYTREQLVLLEHMIKEHDQTLNSMGTNPIYWEQVHTKLHKEVIPNDHWTT
jgi:hypothetical protein